MVRRLPPMPTATAAVNESMPPEYAPRGVRPLSPARRSAWVRVEKRCGDGAHEERGDGNLGFGSDRCRGSEKAAGQITILKAHCTV